jgi:hypothetical protein
MVKSTLKSDTIALSAKYFLNDKGIEYCLWNRIPHREMHSYGNERASGFEWRSCRSDLLMKLVADDLLSSVEMTRSEFLSVRAPLIKLTHIILTGVLVSRFRSDLKRRFLSDPMVAALTFLREGGSLKRGAAAAKFENGKWIDSIRRAIETECAKIQVSEDADEREVRKCCSQLISTIDEDTMLILACTGSSLLGVTAEATVAYATRMGIAELLSLMLVEFIQLAEKSYLQNLAERDRYGRTHPQELQQLLVNPDFRERLMEIAARRGESMVLNININAILPNQESRTRLDFSTRTRGLIGYHSRYDVVNHRVKEVKKMDLGSLLKIAAGNEQGAELGLVYYSNLTEACEKAGMAFTSSVILDESRDETIASMGVTI